MEVHYITEPEDQPFFSGEQRRRRLPPTSGEFVFDEERKDSTEGVHTPPTSPSAEHGQSLVDRQVSPTAARCLSRSQVQKARKDAIQRRPSKSIWNEAEEDAEPFGQQPNLIRCHSSIRSQADLPLAVFLADLAQGAPERAAEGMVERLQQACFKEALDSGTTSHVADMHFDGMIMQDFVDRVAKLCVTKVEECGFQKVEWWDGRGWRESRGRYNVLHDVVYDRYYARVRVEWQNSVASKSPKRRSRRLPSSVLKRVVSASDSLPPVSLLSGLIGLESSAPLMQELHKMLIEQHQDLKEWSEELTSRAEHAAEAEVAAEKAGRHFQEALKNFYSQPATESSL